MSFPELCLAEDQRRATQQGAELIGENASINIVNTLERTHTYGIVGLEKFATAYFKLTTRLLSLLSDSELSKHNVFSGNHGFEASLKMC